MKKIHEENIRGKNQGQNSKSIGESAGKKVMVQKNQYKNKKDIIIIIKLIEKRCN